MKETTKEKTMWMITVRTRMAGAAGCAAALIFLLAAVAAGCSDDDRQDPREGGQPGGGPVYVIANEVYTADSSTTYINVLDTLDVDEIDYSEAVEYSGGRATIATVGGWLFVAGPEAPIITRFAIGDDGALSADGEVSFAAYGLESIWIDEWGNTFISPTKAYLVNSDDGTTLVWNPTTMEITGEIAPSQSLVRGNMTINGSPGALRGDRLYRTFFWNNWDAWETSAEQYLAVYDVENNELLEMVEETRCPGLSNRVDRDEAGNLYFSNWIWNITETLVRGAPKSCALRVEVDSERFDADWSLPFADATGGREAAMFTYLADGKGLLNVFHDERAAFDETSDPAELASTVNWRLWTMDFDELSGAPLDGLDWMTGGASTFHLDGRSFVFVPGADYSVTRIAEIEGSQAVPHFDVEGWSYQFLKVR